MKNMHILVYALLWIGGLNWGLIGLFNYNLVEALLGSVAGLVSLLYVIIGVAAVYSFATHKNTCKGCKK